MIPGEIFPGPTPIVINEGSEEAHIDVVNAGDRPIQVGSHFHFFEVNRALRFDRHLAYGRRLDIPAGTAVRFEPGGSHRVTLVPFGGRRIVRGLNGLVEGSLEASEARALERVRAFEARRGLDPEGKPELGVPSRQRALPAPLPNPAPQGGREESSLGGNGDDHAP